jgi:hypothetical protein
MLALFILFLLALVTGSQSGKKGFWPLASITLLIFAGMCIIWQDIHGWPGLLNTAFFAKVSPWLIAMILGVAIGGVFLGRMLKKSNP